MLLCTMPLSKSPHLVVPKLTYSQKLILFQKLYEAAWQLKKAGIKRQHQDWSQESINKALKEYFLYART